ncbi:MAG: hypothetical protein ACK5PQ_02460 [Alphaproteobacteria bacterium]
MMHFFYLLVVLVASTVVGWGSWDDAQQRPLRPQISGASLGVPCPKRPQVKRRNQAHPGPLTPLDEVHHEETYPNPNEVQDHQRRRGALKTRASSPLRPTSGAEETTEEETDIDTSPDGSSVEEGQMRLSPPSLQGKQSTGAKSRRVPLLPSDFRGGRGPLGWDQAEQAESWDHNGILYAAGTPLRKGSFQHAKWEDYTTPLDKQDPFYGFAEWVRQHPQNTQQYGVNVPFLKNLFIEDAMAWSLVRQVAQEFCKKGKLKDHTAKRLQDQIEEFQGKDLDEHYKRFMTLLQTIVEQKTQTPIRVEIMGWDYSV